MYVSGSLIYGNATIASQMPQVLSVFYLSWNVFLSWDSWKHVSSPTSMCILQQLLYIIAQGQAQPPAYHLPSFSSSASKMSPRPVCFSNWPLLMKPSVEFRPIQNCRSQMCQVILKPHKNSADITVQIAGNYVFASPGKYAQISSYNWGLLKDKGSMGFIYFLSFVFMFFSAKGTKMLIAFKGF